MSEQPKAIVSAQNWKPKALVIGGVIGAVVGVAAVYILIQHSSDDKPPQISTGQGIKLGVLVLSLLRNISNLT
jgi:hypothetical protein